LPTTINGAGSRRFMDIMSCVYACNYFRKRRDVRATEKFHGEANAIDLDHDIDARAADAEAKKLKEGPLS